VFLYIELLITMVVAFFILGEPITVASVFGGGVILFGVWLVNKTDRRKRLLKTEAGIGWSSIERFVTFIYSIYEMSGSIIKPLYSIDRRKVSWLV